METNKNPGFWILVSFGILLNIFYLAGQTMALVSYDFTVEMGLQEATSEITAVGVALNKGFGLGDTVVYIPLFVAGIVGLFRRKNWGLYTMASAMGITIYWPVVCLSTLFFAKNADGWYFSDYASYTFLLSFIALYGTWGLFYLIRNKNDIVNDN